jgi:hypothetical protein
MRTSVITWPIVERSLPVSTTTSPVTQTAEVEVNNASMNRRGFWAAEIGKLRRIAPVRMTPAKLRIKILVGGRCLKKKVFIRARMFMQRKLLPRYPSMNYRRKNGIKQMIRPYISRRPSSIVNDKIHFPAEGIWTKLLADPTVPRPGPTFPIVAAAPENAERPSRPIAVRRPAEKKTMPTYKQMYKMPEFAISSSTAFPSILIGITALGFLSRLSLRATVFKNNTTLSAFMPPEVELAQAH